MPRVELDESAALARCKARLAESGGRSSIRELVADAHARGFIELTLTRAYAILRADADLVAARDGTVTERARALRAKG